MKPETLKALKKSIAHWKRLATGKRIDGEGITVHDCALCDLFFDSFCLGCPIYDKTIKGLCKGTPYNKAHKALDQYGIDSPEFRAAAKEMLEFLQSLLPTKKVKP